MKEKFNRDIKVILPPSAEGNLQFTNDQALATISVASARSIVERVIGRVREYKMFQPHVCWHHALVQYAEPAIKIACALVNLRNDFYGEEFT